MGNPFYRPGADRASGVRDLFGRIASRYDLINDVQSLGLHRYWKRRLVRLAAPTKQCRALDLCCGTGDVALALAHRGAQVVGLDFSEAMLEVANRRLAKTGESSQRLVFIHGDALRVPFADESFDVVTISYGLRNLASVGEGLREMWRVARPGGRLLILDFGKPEQAFWRAAYFAYLRGLVPWFGRVFAGNKKAYAYILESLEHYPAQRGVNRLLGELPTARTEVFDLLGGMMSINVAEKA